MIVFCGKNAKDFQELRAKIVFRKKLIILLILQSVLFSGCRLALPEIPFFGKSGNNSSGCAFFEPKEEPKESLEYGVNDEKREPLGFEEIRAALSKDEWSQNHQLSAWQESRNEGKSNAFSTDSEAIRNYNALNRLSRNSANDSERTAPSPGVLVSSWRWYNPKLEELVANSTESGENIPAITKCLKDKDQIVVGNAAIALARIGKKDVREELKNVMSRNSFSISMRCAAAEAFAFLPNVGIDDLSPLIKSASERIVTSKNEKGEVKETFLAGEPKLLIELLCSASDMVAPHEHPCFADALSSKHRLVRQTAVRIWKERPMDEIPRTNLPKSLYDCLEAPDVRVRAAALHAIARWKSPDALRFLKNALNDPMVEVRIAAIEGLGIEGSDEAVRQLLKINGDISQKDATRAATVRGLRRAGKHDELLRLSDDKSTTVRTEVAKSLADCESPFGIETARKFLDDSASVQKATISTMEAWSLESAAPILFEALTKRSLTCNDLAKEMLARKWSPDVSEYHFNDSPEVRERILGELREKFESQNGPLRSGVFAEFRSNGSKEVKLPSARVIEEARQNILLLAENPRFSPDHAASTFENEQLHQAFRELSEMRESLIPVLELLIREEKIRVPELLYTRILTHADPVFLALARYAKVQPEPGYPEDRNSLQGRKLVSSEILAYSKQNPITPLAAERLVQLASYESDSGILINIMDSLGKESERYGCRFAVMMVSQKQPELMRRGCEFLGKYGNLEDWTSIEPLLDSLNTDMLRRALAATGKIVSRSEPSELVRERSNILHAIRPLLVHSSKLVQADAALVLYHLDEPDSVSYIERLAFGSDETVQLYLARELGEFGDPEMIPILIRMLEGNGSVRTAALKSLPKLANRDYGSESAEIQKKITAWQEWYRLREKGKGNREKEYF